MPLSPGRERYRTCRAGEFLLRETQHPLKGNMLRNCLQALYLYGLNLQEQGLTPASPPDMLISHAINHRVLALYTRQAAFEVIPGTMTCKPASTH